MISYNHVMNKDIIISSQLQNPDYRFALLRGKIPFEKGWQEKGLSFDDPRLVKWISTQEEVPHSYGVIAGYGRLRVIDIDDISRLKLPAIDTFMVRTGSGGLHIYILSDYNKNHVLVSEGVRVGEFRAERQQVVGPGCNYYNPDKLELTGVYEIVDDKPILDLPVDQVESLLAPYIKQENNPTYALLDKCGDRTRSGLEFLAIRRLIMDGFSKEEIFSKMEKTFSKWNAQGTAYQEKTYCNAIKILGKTDTGKNIPAMKKDPLSWMTEVLAESVEEKWIFKTVRSDKLPELWTYSEGIYVPEGKTYILEFCRNQLGESYNASIGQKVVDKVMADTYVEAAEFFADVPPNLIALQDGVFNLQTKELMVFSPEYHFFNKLPISYIKGKDCPRIIKFFNEVLNPDDIICMQEFFGYLLWKDVKTFDKALMLVGDGSNGKSITLKIMKAFLGQDNYSSISLQDLNKDQFSAICLFKKMANLCGDLSKDALHSTSVFKMATSGDPIEANRKYLTRLKFCNYAKLIFSANELPEVSDDTEGFWRRWLIFIYLWKFVSPQVYERMSVAERRDVKLANPDLLAELILPEELSGLFNWSLCGLDRILENRGFSSSSTSKEIQTTWMRKTSSIQAFIQDAVTITGQGADYIPKDDFRIAYSQYCSRYKLQPSGDIKIKEALLSRGVFQFRKLLQDGRTYVWGGLKVNSRYIVDQDVQLDHPLTDYISSQENNTRF